MIPLTTLPHSYKINCSRPTDPGYKLLYGQRPAMDRTPSMHSEIKVIEYKNKDAWDEYVEKHPDANPYHMYEWLTAIRETYGHNVYALAAVLPSDGVVSSENRRPIEKIVGLLPLVHLKNLFLGNRLVSMPYFDHGGILADDRLIEKRLIRNAILLGRKLNAQRIELRHLHHLEYLQSGLDAEDVGGGNVRTGCLETLYDEKKEPLDLKLVLKEHKVRMLMPLPASSETLLKSFKSKLRSQVKRPVKAGLEAKIGGIELIEDFYRVFSANMRDLGSPVHAKAFPASILERFQDKARIVVVYKMDEPVASSVMVGFRELMINPWSSALRSFSKFSPNMLLYWSMLAYACDHGYRSFDFGRSTANEGTYRFKAQWGAEPQGMYWYTVWLHQSERQEVGKIESPENPNRSLAVNLWRRLPIPISRVFGPIIRKHIDL